jgi:hypothetical protein
VSGIDPECVENVLDHGVTETPDTILVEWPKDGRAKSSAWSIEDQAPEVGQLRGERSPAGAAGVRSMDEQDGRSFAYLLDPRVHAVSS